MSDPINRRTSVLTRDPFTNAALLEEQPLGLRASTAASEDGRAERSSKIHEYERIPERGGTRKESNASHAPRRPSQVHFAPVSPSTERRSHSRSSSEPKSRTSSSVWTEGNIPRPSDHTPPSVTNSIAADGSDGGVHYPPAAVGQNHQQILTSENGEHPISKTKRKPIQNFSRKINKVDSDEEEDKISELPPTESAPGNGWNPNFAFDGSNRGRSNSLAEFYERLEKYDESDALDENRPRRRSSCVLQNRRKSKYSIKEEAIVRAIGKKRLRWTKYGFLLLFLCMNSACVAISWLYPQYWYLFVPVILLGNVMNSFMVLNIIRWYAWSQLKRLFGRTKSKLPLTPDPTTIAMVLACYCESQEEITATLDSLCDQDGVDHHQRMFVIVCDGQVKGKGMNKSTDRLLVENIFEPTEEMWFPLGYESWDGVINGVYASSGKYRGIPYVCLVKKRNLGKRDGLILVRTLLYKYKMRAENPEATLGDDFFRWFCEFSESCGIEKFEWLVGVDADTTFNRTCIYEMHKECLKNPKLIGCSGLIKVGFRTGNWNLYNIYQNTEYLRAQCLRRWHQAHGTGKVSCLPGACQIIKICEESCGDEILIELFGSIPDPKANMIHQIRALAGEDRNYICLIFAQYSYVQTTMALNAIAYTDPPNGVMVFLSQRKRWTLSTCANDMLICAKNKMNWFERCCSAADILVWGLPWFVMQTFILFIKACIRVTDPTFIACFAIVTMIPLTYSLFVTYWGCTDTRDRLQYLLGLFMVIALSQFITPIVISYAIWHMDDFSWGKTREVQDDGNPENKPAHS